MNRTAEFATLYVCENDRTLPLNLNSWITKNEPFTGPLIAKGFWGPGEVNPMYVEIARISDVSDNKAFMNALIWWCIDQGVLFDIRDSLSTEPYSLETAGAKMVEKQANSSQN